MSTIQRTIFCGTRRVGPYNSLYLLSCTRRSFTQRLVRENDIVLLKPEGNRDALPTLSKPLKPGDSVVFRDHRKVKAEDVIGKPYRSLVAGGRRAVFRIYEPTLGQYCDNAPRIVTPIYSSDANLIVSLLDLNYTAVPSAQSEAVQEIGRLAPNRPLEEPTVSEVGKKLELEISPREDETEESESSEPIVSLESQSLVATDITEDSDILETTELLQKPKSLRPEILTPAEQSEKWDFLKDDNSGRLEIFEAGTGHGSLTLHLARAIHGANSRAPSIPKFPKTSGKINADDDIYRYGGRTGSTNQQMLDIYNEWRSQRRAVIHTLDSNENHSRHAQRTIRNYRHGAYFPHIDFHVGNIHEYLSQRLEETNDVFLDHAILDLPRTHDEMEIVGKCLKPDGRLIAWCPSITQHMKCLETVKGKKLPFALERVLELGSQLGTGGREWDVRAVKPRVLLRAEKKKMAQKLAQYDKEKKTDPAVESFFAKISKKGGSKSFAEVETGSKLREEGVKASESESIAVQAGCEEEGKLDDMSDWEMICRPKVGDRVSGGGFVGVWKKMDLNM